MQRDAAETVVEHAATLVGDRGRGGFGELVLGLGDHGRAVFGVFLGFVGGLVARQSGTEAGPAELSQNPSVVRRRSLGTLERSDGLVEALFALGRACGAKQATDRRRSFRLGALPSLHRLAAHVEGLGVAGLGRLGVGTRRDVLVLVGRRALRGRR